MLEFVDINVSIGGVEILRSAGHVVPHGQIHALTGPSGSGKTTLLRAIAGLIPRSTGKVVVDGVDVSSTAAHLRGIGLAFQEPYLFDTMTVRDNIAYALKIRGASRREQSAVVSQMLELVDLEGFESRTVDSLSGGQARRIALARHLAPRPSVLLLDEPFAALDSTTQNSLVRRVHEFIRKNTMTVMASTHMHFDASGFADRIVDISEIDPRR